MSRRPRWNHTAAFKTKVALAALKGEKPLSELTEQIDLHANQIMQWKSQLLEGAAVVFGETKEQESSKVDVTNPHAKIGELGLERDFLESALSKAGLLGAKSCLLRNLAVTRPNQVWATDISYIPMKRGFVYLVAVIDWFSRRVLSWKLSITMDVSFYLEALDEALAKYGKPEIFNTNQGSQFTSEAFTGRLKKEGINISMDGKGRWCDNVFVERFRRSIKYEEIYLHAYESVSEARSRIGQYIQFFNNRRPHSSLQTQTPDQVYFNRPLEQMAA
ncbi:MAG: IS3 family transposase [Terracidiphilus sp.]|nr:IS3 family transposase [Terracidiphilus sp.]